MGRRLRLIVGPLVILIAALGCTTTAQPSTDQPQSCIAPFSIGYHIVSFTGSRHMAVWYPSDDAQATYRYTSTVSTTLAYNGRPTSRCGRFPLIVFSHGLGGCGTQSIFFTETLARQGYVVAAPDHQDTFLCRVEQPNGGASDGGGAQDEPSTFNPSVWTDATYADRKDDVERAIALMTSGTWRAVTDAGEIGVVGHSLGGYTALGVAGGWPSWMDQRIKAALLFSPYSLPFSIQHTLTDVHVPLMYQGAATSTSASRLFSKVPMALTRSPTCPSTSSSCWAATTSPGRCCSATSSPRSQAAWRPSLPPSSSMRTAAPS